MIFKYSYLGVDVRIIQKHRVFFVNARQARAHQFCAAQVIKTAGLPGVPWQVSQIGTSGFSTEETV